MRFGAGRGTIVLAVGLAFAALIGTGIALAGRASEEAIAYAPSMTLVEDDPDAEIPSDDLDHLLATDDEEVELLPYWMGGRESLENVRFDVGDEFA
jgi:hypothetical protein